jgi:hypothetical protein
MRNPEKFYKIIKDEKGNVIGREWAHPHFHKRTVGSAQDEGEDIYHQDHDKLEQALMLITSSTGLDERKALDLIDGLREAASVHQHTISEYRDNLPAQPAAEKGKSK